METSQMPKSYHHMTLELRSQIFTLKSIGLSCRAIAAHVGVHYSTIYRELYRNSTQSGYSPSSAQVMASKRRHVASSRPKTITPELRDIILELLKKDFSPVQISGRLKKTRGICVSHETIYRMISKNKREKGNLYTHLRHKGKKYNKRGSKNAGRGCIPGRIDIDARPKIVDQKVRIGDWEGDLVIGSQTKGVVLMTLVDRASKFTIIRRLYNKTAKGSAKAIISALKGLPCHTITSDNGKEFAAHARVSKALRTLFFFAKPYHSWERGLNEHTNGLIRQYLPKGTSFEGLSLKNIRIIAGLPHINKYLKTA